MTKERFFPTLPNLFEEELNWLPTAAFTKDTGLTVSSDEKNVFVTAALPGLSEDNIEVAYEKGQVWVKGNKEREEKDKNKKFYRKSSQNFSYHVTLPEEVDENQEPIAELKDGELTITFAKSSRHKPKKISVKKK